MKNSVHAVSQLAAPLGRGLLASIFIVSGINKILGYSGTQAYMEAMGVPGFLLPVVIALEVAGGIAVLLGWQARLSAFLLAGFCVLSALLFHSNLSDQMQMLNFMKNLTIAGGFLMIVAHGAGKYSLDYYQQSALEQRS